MDCRLMQEVKRYESAWRMVLSGTPLQVRFLFASLHNLHLGLNADVFLSYRIIWRSFGPYSTLSFPISSTTLILSRNGTSLPPFSFTPLTNHLRHRPGLTCPRSLPRSPPPNPHNSSPHYTTSSNPSSSAVSKSTWRSPYRRRKSTCSTRH